METATKPLYRHDCLKCIYMGTVHVGPSLKAYDLYYCPNHSDWIARYDSDGPDYVCAPAASQLLRSITNQPGHWQIFESVKGASHVQR